MSTVARAPLGKIAGYGAAAEPGARVGIDADGKVIALAVRRARRDAGCDPSDIDFVVAHGTATKLGDSLEIKAMGQIFSETPPLVYHKWLFGHLLGASGMASLILAIDHLIAAICHLTRIKVARPGCYYRIGRSGTVELCCSVRGLAVRRQRWWSVDRQRVDTPSVL